MNNLCAKAAYHFTAGNWQVLRQVKFLGNLKTK